MQAVATRPAATAEPAAQAAVAAKRPAAVPAAAASAVAAAPAREGKEALAVARRRPGAAAEPRRPAGAGPAALVGPRGRSPAPLRPRGARPRERAPRPGRRNRESHAGASRERPLPPSAERGGPPRKPAARRVSYAPRSLSAAPGPPRSSAPGPRAPAGSCVPRSACRAAGRPARAAASRLPAGRRRAEAGRLPAGPAEAAGRPRPVAASARAEPGGPGQRLGRLRGLSLRDPRLGFALESRRVLDPAVGLDPDPFLLTLDLVDFRPNPLFGLGRVVTGRGAGSRRHRRQGGCARGGRGEAGRRRRRELAALCRRSDPSLEQLALVGRPGCVQLALGFRRLLASLLGRAADRATRLLATFSPFAQPLFFAAFRLFLAPFAMLGAGHFLLIAGKFALVLRVAGLGGERSGRRRRRRREAGWLPVPGAAAPGWPARRQAGVEGVAPRRPHRGRARARRPTCPCAGPAFSAAWAASAALEASPASASWPCLCRDAG